MWAQLLKVRTKPGREDDVVKIVEKLREAEQPGSGLIRSVATRDQRDPAQVYFFIVFESEEKARAREGDERRQAALQDVRALMADVFDGPPEFVNLEVVAETVG